MDDQPDDQLKQRIKEVFDNYGDASADEGWLQLREKFPERGRRRAVLWIWSAAAVLLLFLGFAIRLYEINNKQVDNKKISYHIKSVQPLKPVLKEQNPFIVYQPKTDITHNPVHMPTGSSTGSRLTVANRSMATAASKPNSVTAKQTVGDKSQAVYSSRGEIAHQTNSTTAIPVDSAKKIFAPNTSGLITDVQQRSVVPDTQAKAFPVIKPKTSKTIQDMFAADQDKTSEETRVNADKKVRFGVYAASYFNYAKGSNNQVNVGAGFTADIVLTGNLKLVTGLSVNQNSFAYNNSDVNPAVPAANYGNAGSGGSISTYTQKASLLGLNIPLDLKYVLNNRKNQVYVLAGVESGTFINESYAYLNNNGSTAASLQSDKGLNDFYFARTINMALGVGYPLGKDQIVIEPFVKYPLQGLGAEQLRFGASGINLKFNFSIKK